MKPDELRQNSSSRERGGESRLIGACTLFHPSPFHACHNLIHSFVNKSSVFHNLQGLNVFSGNASEGTLNRLHHHFRLNQSFRHQEKMPGGTNVTRTSVPPGIFPPGHLSYPGIFPPGQIHPDNLAPGQTVPGLPSVHHGWMMDGQLNCFSVPPPPCIILNILIVYIIFSS